MHRTANGPAGGLHMDYSVPPSFQLHQQFRQRRRGLWFGIIEHHYALSILLDRRDRALYNLIGRNILPVVSLGINAPKHQTLRSQIGI